MSHSLILATQIKEAIATVELENGPIADDLKAGIFKKVFMEASLYELERAKKRGIPQ